MLRLYLYARVRFLVRLLHTRPRVQQAPGIPCALLFWAKRLAKPGRNAPRECEGVCFVGIASLHPYGQPYSVAPHLQLSSSAKADDPVSQIRQRLSREAAAYWIPAFAGMTTGCGARFPSLTLRAAGMTV